MARYNISTSAADPVRPYLEGVAKSLVDRLYGEKGPAWGTKLTAIEDTIQAIRHVLSEKMLDEALQRQVEGCTTRFVSNGELFGVRPHDAAWDFLLNEKNPKRPHDAALQNACDWQHAFSVAQTHIVHLFAFADR